MATVDLNQIDAFYQDVYDVLMQHDITLKIKQLKILQQAWQDGDYAELFASQNNCNDASGIGRFSDIGSKLEPVIKPGQPERPELVEPAKLKSRGLGSDTGRASFIHAIAHIEFNAINLALDALYRFRYLPSEFYANWLQVASEEAKHFTLLNTRLSDYGYAYGDFPAHSGLWDMALQTRHSLLARMALIPMVFEARGLDVTPDMIKRLQQVGDKKTADILGLILEEEVGHVAFGRACFVFECQRLGYEPQQALIDLVKEYMPNKRLGPFNYDYRQAAGFEIDELQALEGLS